MTAIERFREGLLEVETILGLDTSCHSSLPDNSVSPEVNGTIPHVGVTVRRAATVLLVSHFEGFLKSLAEELVDAFSTGDLPSRRIPQQLRQAHTVPRLSEIVACANTTQRSALLAKLNLVSSLWKDDAKPPAGTLKASLVAAEIRSAKSECIDSMFKLFGVTEGVCNGRLDSPAVRNFPAETHDISTRLGDIVKCRNDIAHGDIDRQPTTDDVQRYVIFLQYFAERLQREADAIAQSVAS